MHVRGVLPFLWFFTCGARRSIRVDDSHRDAQQQSHTLANVVEVSAETEDALIPEAFGTRAFRRTGARAGALREWPERSGRHAAHLETHRAAPGLRFGPRRANVALQAGGDPEEAEFIRSDDDWDYFRKQKRISATLSKPIGAVLEAANLGVVVVDVEEGGSAFSTGLVKKGDRIAAVMGQDVSVTPFDDVMKLLRDAPDEVVLEVLRSVVVRRPRAAAPAESTQQPDKLEAAFQKNFGSSEAAGKLGNKILKTVTNPVTWKNDIYFWSLVSVVVPLALIAAYSALK